MLDYDSKTVYVPALEMGDPYAIFHKEATGADQLAWFLYLSSLSFDPEKAGRNSGPGA